MCDVLGRDSFSGKIRIEALIAALEAMGGDKQDLDRAMALEIIWLKNNGQRADADEKD